MTAMTLPVGRVVATEQKPSTPHQFYFWTARVSPIGIGAIVRVEGEGRVVHAVVTDGFAYSDLVTPLHAVLGAVWRLGVSSSHRGWGFRSSPWAWVTTDPGGSPAHGTSSPSLGRFLALAAWSVRCSTFHRVWIGRGSSGIDSGSSRY